jgi:hypothetical protein
VGPVKPYKEHLRERLNTTDDYVGYLDACHKDGPETFALAVQDVADFVGAAMRSACIEKVAALRDRNYTSEYAMYWLRKAIEEIEATTIQEQEKQSK